jgi:hypothetical protein
MNKQELEKTCSPDAHNFNKKIDYLPTRNGLRPGDDKSEGTKLHGLIEIFLKGSGIIRNMKSFHNFIQHYKFTYDFFRVINTLCYIVGK